jgi:hypothetical protein
MALEGLGGLSQLLEDGEGLRLMIETSELEVEVLKLDQVSLLLSRRLHTRILCPSHFADYVALP